MQNSRTALAAASYGRTGALFSEVGEGGRAHGFEPAADVDLGVAFAAVVAGAGGFGGFVGPLEYGEVGITALDYEPADGIAGDDAANFTSEFLKRGHGFTPPLCERQHTL